MFLNELQKCISDLFGKGMRGLVYKTDNKKNTQGQVRESENKKDDTKMKVW